jgi:putative peptidoglycan lipid II flippase
MADAPPASSHPVLPPEETGAKHAAPLTNRRIIRSTLIVMMGFMFTKLVSLAQVFIIADRFGAGADYDTYVLANKVPAQLIKFIGVGALSVAFIPIFSGLLNRHESSRAWRLASQLFNTLLLVTLLISLGVFGLADVLVERFVAPGFSDSQVTQTAAIMRILLLSTVIFTLSSLITGVLNGHNHFFLTVLAPIFFDFGLLFGVIFFIDPLGIYGLAWGTVLGAILHFAIQTPGLVMFKARWSFSLGWRDPLLHQVIRLMIPRMVASGVFAINFLVIGNIASRMGEGAPSAFDWGIRIMDIPEALIGTALGFVIFPTLAALSELGEVDQRRRLFSRAVRFIIIATLPAAGGMIVIGRPAVSILFTDVAEADLVYAVVQIMALAMILQAVHEVVARAFYAQKDTLTPLYVSVTAMVVNIVVLVVGFNFYRSADSIPLAGPFGVGGLALGYLSIFLTELGLLLIVLRRRWGDIEEPAIRATLQRAVAATLFMAIPVALIDYGLSQTVFTEATRMAGLVRVGIGGSIGASLFLIGAVLFNIEEVKQLPRLVRRRGQTIEAEPA